MTQTKTEPKSKAINPRAVAGIGVQEVRTRSVPMYEGRGFTAPKSNDSTHKSGSQGKH